MGGEFERLHWIDRTVRSVPLPRRAGRLLVPIGDDAAIWRPPECRRALALTIDTQVEGVHFKPRWLTPFLLGRRAVHIAASDLAAMAAEPAGLLIALNLPQAAPEKFFRELFRGLVEAARDLGLEIFGGNLSSGPLAVTVAVLGHGRPGAFPRRSGARPGEAIWVTGHPGRAGIGRAVLEAPRPLRSRAARSCARAFQEPRARIAAARALAERVRLGALIDLSDGLAADLGRILEESGKKRGPLGAVLEERTLLSLLEDPKRSPHQKKMPVASLARSLGLDPLHAVLEGGEDYELLFTANGREAGAMTRCARQLGLPITRIGRVARGRGGIWLEGEGKKPRRWRPRGFDHFKNSTSP
ncbi:MAG: thiamine-phosphate kinase [Planctomycetes bacterium]|nr:thiamine-phosphate kinase [Planctomycetota bacterium]